MDFWLTKKYWYISFTIIYQILKVLKRKIRFSVGLYALIYIRLKWGKSSGPNRVSRAKSYNDALFGNNVSVQKTDQNWVGYPFEWFPLRLILSLSLSLNGGTNRKRSRCTIHIFQYVQSSKITVSGNNLYMFRKVALKRKRKKEQ